MGGGWQTVVAAEMGQAGASLDEITAALPGIRQGIVTALTVDTLKYLVAGGRLSPIQGMMGTLLSDNPKIVIDEGILKPVGRERGRRRAKQRLIELVRARAGDRPLRVVIANGNVPDEAAELGEQVQAALTVQELIVLEIGPVLAALAGPGVIAMAVYQVTS